MIGLACSGLAPTCDLFPPGNPSRHRPLEPRVRSGFACNLTSASPPDSVSIRCASLTGTDTCGGPSVPPPVARDPFCRRTWTGCYQATLYTGWSMRCSSWTYRRSRPSTGWAAPATHRSIQGPGGVPDLRRKSRGVRAGRKIERMCGHNTGYRFTAGCSADMPDHTVIARLRRYHSARTVEVFRHDLAIRREAGCWRSRGRSGRTALRCCRMPHWTPTGLPTH
jgi:hypothetical protein